MPKKNVLSTSRNRLPKTQGRPLVRIKAELGLVYSSLDDHSPAKHWVSQDGLSPSSRVSLAGTVYKQFIALLGLNYGLGCVRNNRSSV
ncbi:hypothetical protein JTE90_004996 [Oedothorax gibbosus]|uniref:Uncharacterized protein n=1 Tax=Oedothorax gibbosus TaxID=931172 RepID=A0AAV6VDC4_9ARAC|nr:hypothetical protein JTE90_004996 [Oedothorax gibbosus]